MFIYDKEYFYKVILNCNKEIITDIIDDKATQYNEYNIPKHNGTRTIHAINAKSALYQVQKNLKINFLEKINIPIPAKGFVKEESYISYLVHHTGKNYYLRMDIKSFFNSITEKHIKESMSEFVRDEDIIKTIIEIVTLNGTLPQGSVTSPIISNIVFRRIDQRILKYCQETKVTYTRYADDLLFSSDYIDFENDKFFCSMIKKILKDNEFVSNYNKKKTGNSQICLSGFVVGQDVHLSRNKLKNINTLLYYFRKNKDFSKNKYRVDKQLLNDDNWLDKINALNIIKNGQQVIFQTPMSLINYLCGYRAFLLSFIKNTNDLLPKHDLLVTKIKNIEKVVDAIVRKEDYNI